VSLYSLKAKAKRRVRGRNGMYGADAIGGIHL